jgi:hypothetical protein
MSKSFTTLEQKICLVTGKTFDSGALLIDEKMREKFEMHTVTGYGISPEVQEKLDDGYIALVGVDMEKSPIMDNGNLDPKTAHRTGNIAYLRRHVLEEIVPDLVVEQWAFTDEGFLTYLSELPVKGE